MFSGILVFLVLASSVFFFLIILFPSNAHFAFLSFFLYQDILGKLINSQSTCEGPPLSITEEYFWDYNIITTFLSSFSLYNPLAYTSIPFPHLLLIHGSF